MKLLVSLIWARLGRVSKQLNKIPLRFGTGDIDDKRSSETEHGVQVRTDTKSYIPKTVEGNSIVAINKKYQTHQHLWVFPYWQPVPFLVFEIVIQRKVKPVEKEGRKATGCNDSRVTIKVIRLFYALLFFKTLHGMDLLQFERYES